MLPFLLLATRDHDEAAEAEYASVLRHTGLAADELIRVRVEAEPLPPITLDDYSGVILGGSSFNISDDVKSSLQQRVEDDLAAVLARVVDQDVPFLGLCYGVGAITRHIGGTVDREFGEPVGAIEVTLTPSGRQDALLAGLGERFWAFVGHKEACSALPTTAEVLAIGVDCPVQMYRVGRNVYVTQFHPELDADDLEARMRIYRDHGYYDPAELGQLVDLIHNSPVDGRQHLVLRNFVQRYRREGSA